jgi:ATP-dependent RNA helicase RhlE
LKSPGSHPRSRRPRRSRSHERDRHRQPSPSKPASPRTDRPPFEIAPHDATPVEFGSLGLDPRITRALGDLGFVRTTPIQSAVFHAVRAGGDLVGCAETGTGKTAAFMLPIIERLLAAGDRTHESTRVLILAPTRELAVQIEEDFQGLAYHTGLTAVAVYGGVSAGGQERGLRAPVDVVVATPGRLLDHMTTETHRFQGLEVLVLDEADRMLDMGFWPSVRRIVEALPATRQTLLFSATMSGDVVSSASQIMRAPKMIQVGQSGLATTITHVGHIVPTDEKASWLAGFLRKTDGPKLVFVRTKRGADRLARRLSAAGIRCAPLHADLTQGQRTAAVEGFRAGRFSALVATDIAARGLDIERIAHVINFDVPSSVETYVHRVGRTGRAELAGIAVTLASPDELAILRAIEQSLNVGLLPA